MDWLGDAPVLPSQLRGRGEAHLHTKAPLAWGPGQHCLPQELQQTQPVNDYQHQKTSLTLLGSC